MGGPPSANVFHASLSAAVAVALASCLLVATPASAALQTSRAAVRSGAKANGPDGSASMSYLLKTIGRFKNLAAGSEQGVDSRHQAEELRLRKAIQLTQDEGVKLALVQSMNSNRRSLLETRRIYSSMVNFSNSMVNLLTSATSRGHGCEQTACGEHASCTDTTKGPQCVCNEGYVGVEGQNCHPPPEFMPHFLMDEGKDGTMAKAADLHVHVFEGSKIAVVFRDLSKGNIGQILVGKVREAGMADMSPPEQFTVPGGRAFSPVVAGTTGGRIAIAWRDENRRGTCFMRGAALGTSGMHGADMAMTWGSQVNFCSDQGHKMAIMPLPGNRVVVLYSDKAKATPHTPVESFGNSLLADVGVAGEVTLQGKFRFSDAAVCRLEATKVAPSAFMVAARASRAVDDMSGTASTRQEAMAMYGFLADNDLVFDPNPVNLEPDRTQIWSRGVSLIAPNTVAYAYQDGNSMKMKMAVIQIDPATHRMKLIREPAVVRSGFSPYVSMLSVPYTPSDPHTLMYYEGDDGSSKVNLCSWSPKKAVLDRCEDFTWLASKLTSVAGAHLSGGKSFMVFTPESGVPFYSVFSLSKK